MRDRCQDSDSGVYIAVFYLSEDQDITVGKLGRLRFRKGYYFYVGSAQRNLAARLERHGRKSKPMRWHIDYLSVRAEMLGAITITGPRETECELAKEFATMFERTERGFGASDCHCGGHLFFASQLP